MNIDLDELGALIADMSADVLLGKDITHHLPIIDEQLQVIDYYLTGDTHVKQDMISFCLMQVGYWFYKFRDVLS